MDVEYGGGDLAHHAQSVNEGIELKIPSKIQKLISELKACKDRARQIHMNGKRHTKTGEEKQPLFKIEENEFKKLQEIYGNQTDLTEATNNLKDDLYNLSYRQTQLTISKNLEYTLQINQEIEKCQKYKGYRYHIIFLEFDSFSLTEMNDVIFMAGKGSEKDEILIINTEVSDEDKIIDDLDKMLREHFELLRKSLERTAASSKLREDVRKQIILYFSDQFYLSELALEKLITYIDEEFADEGFRFILIFKKIEDASYFPVSYNTHIRVSPYKGGANPFYDFLKAILNNDSSSSHTAHFMLGPSMVEGLMLEYDMYRMSFKTMAHKIECMIRLHTAQHKTFRKPTMEEEVVEYEISKMYFRCGYSFFLDLLYYRRGKEDPAHIDMFQIYSDPSGERSSTLKNKDISKKLQKSTISIQDLLISYDQHLDLKTISDHAMMLHERLKKLEKKIADEAESLNLNIVGDSPLAHALKDIEDIEARINTLSVRAAVKTKSQDTVARDPNERAAKLRMAGGATSGLGESSPERDQIVIQIRHLLRDLYKRTIEQFNDLLTSKYPDFLIFDYDGLCKLIDPDIVGNYMDELLMPVKSKSQTFDHSVKALLELIGQESLKFSVVDIQRSFLSKMLSLFPKADKQLLAHQFYVALNMLKRAGLVHEANRTRQILIKKFYSRTSA